MQRTRSLCHATGVAVLLSSCALLIGCSTTRTRIAQTLASEQPAAAANEQANAESYRIGCPDEVEIVVASMPEISGVYRVGPDGRIPLAILGNPRVEGHTVAGLADCVASEFGLPIEQVKCRVKDHRRCVVFVHGPVDGGSRAVAYRGPENVVTFIRRCGGLTNGADFKDVHIIRPNVAHGAKPQVIIVDLEAILLNGDPRTNVMMQPFDEICVGELARSKVGKALPHWLRPVYRGFCHLFPWGCAQDWREQVRDVEK